MGAILSISILADASKARRELDATGRDLGTFAARAEESSGRVDSSMAGVGSSLAGVGKAVALAGAAVAVGVGAIAAVTVSKASDLQQSIGGVDAVFKESAATIHAWADGAANDFGLSKNEFNELATVTGSQLKNMGIPMKDVTGKTRDLTQKASDLAAQFGGSTKDAMQAIGSLMRGEADPIERYGVSIKKTDVNARLAAKGLDKLSGEALKQAEALTLLDLLNEQTADSTGAFARESATLAGSQQRLSAGWKNMQTMIGTALLPVVAALTNVLLNRLPLAIGFLQPKLEAMSAWMLDVGAPAIHRFADAIEEGIGRAMTWIRDVAAPAMHTFGETIKTGIGGAITFLDDLIGRTPLGTALGILVDFFKTEPGRQFLDFLELKLQPVFDTLQKFVTDTVMPALDTFKTWATDVAVPVFVNAVLTAFTSISDVLTKTIGPKLDELKTKVTDVGFIKGSADAKTFGDTLTAFYNDHLKPLGDYLGELFIAHVTTVVGFFSTWATIVKDILTPVLLFLWENVFKPLVTFIKENGEVFEALGRVLRVLGTVIAIVLLIPLGLLIGAFILAVTAIGLVTVAIVALMAGCYKLVQVFWDVLQNVKNAVSDIFFAVKEKFDEVVAFVQGLPKRITDVAGGMFDGIKGAMRSVLAWVSEQWNKTIGSLKFTVPEWVPGIGGKSFEFPRMEIPALAAGGVITRPTILLAGEAGPEAIIPLSKINSGIGDTVYNISVATTGLGADNPSVSRDVVAAIRNHERRNGPLYAPPVSKATTAPEPVGWAGFVGDGVERTFTFPHGLGTTDVLVEVYRAADGVTVPTDVTRLDPQTVEVTFPPADPPPWFSEYRAVIVPAIKGEADPTEGSWAIHTLAPVAAFTGAPRRSDNVLISGDPDAIYAVKAMRVRAESITNPGGQMLVFFGQSSEGGATHDIEATLTGTGPFDVTVPGGGTVANSGAGTGQWFEVTGSPGNAVNGLQIDMTMEGAHDDVTVAWQTL